MTKNFQKSLAPSASRPACPQPKSDRQLVEVAAGCARVSCSRERLILTILFRRLLSNRQLI